MQLCAKDACPIWSLLLASHDLGTSWGTFEVYCDVRRELFGLPGQISSGTKKDLLPAGAEGNSVGMPSGDRVCSPPCQLDWHLAQRAGLSIWTEIKGN